MTHPKAIIWEEGPTVGIPESPALFTDTENLWLSYETSSEGLFAVVKFRGVIDHHLTPINDEGLGKHPYAKAGLQFYSFHEIMNSHAAKVWATLQARHWVITSKDNALDVLARSVEIVTLERNAKGAPAALLKTIGNEA